ncbi:MAG TPA: DoxX family protein [Planctomycetota bacterium]|nr:DoxX family protein [Planctomycetota bacterium]
MPTPSSVSAACRAVARVFDSLVPIAPLLTRIVLGQAFFQTGLGKWRNFDHTTTFFDSLGLPFPQANAAFIATLELVGGCLLVLGLGTRVVAALLSCTMVVAILTADRGDFLAALAHDGDKGLTDVVPLVFLMLLLWLVAHGAGSISVDRYVCRKRATADPSGAARG